MDPNEVKRIIETGLPGALVEVTGDGTHFEAVIVHENFEGKNTLAQHRLVYGALGERMRADVHALSMRTYTPAEWAARQT